MNADTVKSKSDQAYTDMLERSGLSDQVGDQVVERNQRLMFECGFLLGFLEGQRDAYREMSAAMHGNDAIECALREVVAR